MNQLTKVIVLLVIVLGAVGFWYFNRFDANAVDPDTGVSLNEFIEESQASDPSKEFAFRGSGLRTNTAVASIPLDKVLSGGPGKDGIPAINNPKFISVADAEKQVTPDIDGLLVKVDEEVKFYPYTIMVWHEIVNDVVGGKPLVVTFCPLCGSAIVFEAETKSGIEQFGVSGRLFESNLLMYDRSSESLWSQSIGTAVVGDRTGEELTVYPSQLVSFKTVTEKWPDAKVLSTDTGFSRDYQFYPYGDYDTNEDIYFPISITDERLPAKEIMYVVNAYDHSVAFKLKDLDSNVISVDVGGQSVTASIDEGVIIVKDATGKTLPGYHEMWFSWAIHHQEDGVVWTNNINI